MLEAGSAQAVAEVVVPKQSQQGSHVGVVVAVRDQKAGYPVADDLAGPRGQSYAKVGSPWDMASISTIE